MHMTLLAPVIYHNGVLGGNRTHNHLLRRQVLYPVELRGQLAEGLLKGLSSDCSIFSGRNFRAGEARESRELTRKGTSSKPCLPLVPAMARQKRRHAVARTSQLLFFASIRVIRGRKSRLKKPVGKGLPRAGALVFFALPMVNRAVA